MARVRAAVADALGDIATRIAANEPMRDEDRERIIELARGAGGRAKATMAQTLDILSHRTETLTSMRGIVYTMKTLSAINALLYDHAATAIEAYQRTILEGFRAFVRHNRALMLSTKRAPIRAVVAFGSDHGLCGGYNELLADDVSKHLERHGHEPTSALVLCVGARMKVAVVVRGILPERTLLPPASADGIGRLAGVLAARLEKIWHQSQPDEPAVDLAFTQRVAGGSQ
tara:strand:+ start:1045 stop:1734 length:690 start_codon:yes stop_codon:yes gene_type:complete